MCGRQMVGSAHWFASFSMVYFGHPLQLTKHSRWPAHVRFSLAELPRRPKEPVKLQAGLAESRRLLPSLALLLNLTPHCLAVLLARLAVSSCFLAPS